MDIVGWGEGDVCPWTVGEKQKSIFLPTSPPHCLTLKVPRSYKEGNPAEAKNLPWSRSGFPLSGNLYHSFHCDEHVRLEHHQPGGKNWAKLLQGAWSNRKAWTPSRLREGIGLKVSNTSFTVLLFALLHPHPSDFSF